MILIASDLVLRPAIEPDVPALIRVLRRSWLVAWAPELPFEAVQAFVAFDPARGHAEEGWPSFLVAEVDGVAVGMIEFAGDAVEHLNVDPACWGRGIGSSLMDEAERRIGLGNPTARLEVRAFNRRALDFYRRRGWIEARRYAGTECGASVETVAMTKQLWSESGSLDPATDRAPS